MNKRESNLVYRYGITEREFDWLKRGQSDLCAICRKVEPTDVDHDHGHCPGKRGCRECIRGLLCRSCNAALGQFESGRTRLSSITGYAQWRIEAEAYLGS
jgi:hypothetical protein